MVTGERVLWDRKKRGRIWQATAEATWLPRFSQE